MSRWLQKEMKKIEADRIMSVSFLQRITKFMPDKPKLQFAQECLKNMHLSDEELVQFDSEMMADPPVFIKNGKNFESSITITEHYLKAAFLYRKEIDYGIFRLSDIAMTSLELSKSPVIIRPTGRIFDVYLMDANGKRIGGVSMQSEKYYKEFQAALEKYSPDTRLEVSLEEIEKIRKKR